ncbi:oxidoreductase [Actinocorallia aurea]
MPGGPLNSAEQELWDAYPRGELVDLTGRPDREVGAAVIARLLLGAVPREDGYIPAVRLRGALITGLLDLASGDVDCEFALTSCVLDTTPSFGNTSIRRLMFLDCALPGFAGAGLRTEAALRFTGSVIAGQLTLDRAQLAGGLVLNGTTITAQNENFAVFAGDMAVESGLFARNARIEGGMRLARSRVNGGVFLEGAELLNPGRFALDGQNIVIGDALECSHGFRADGTVKLRGARVEGTLSFDQAARLSSPGRLAIQLSHSDVAELILTPAAPIEGIVSLSYAKIGVLLDRTDVWPAQLRLDGAVYESLRVGDPEARLDWVDRDPDGFRAQPYEQLSAWALRDGREDLARRAQLMKFRRRRRSQPLRTRMWGALLDYTVGYGYRPWLAAAWLAAIITAGTAIFTAIPPRPIKEAAELPDFQALIYVVDLLIPIGAFGLRGAWDPVGWTQWAAYAIIASGWILATALIAGVTRVLRPA